MEPLDIKKYPDVVLRKRCVRLQEMTDSETILFEKMLFTMRHFAGIGLAAPQIGISKRLIVADIGEGAIKLANPIILKSKGLDQMEEGCLSIPGVGVAVDRPDEVIVSGLNEKGRAIEVKTKGLMARVLQHEIDHLNGKLIIDYLTLFEKLKLKIQGQGELTRGTNVKKGDKNEHKNPF
ncbi:MAG: peptide deformylase [Candidatus Omnitrophica bacterium]|nr:peptide deformylase [Candidatus Omnitrophota bacterium]